MFDDNLKADANVQPCKHLVFVASDFDFDYVAPEMTRFLEDKQFKMDAPEDYADGIDALTDALELPRAVKFAAYEGAPSFAGMYVGFSPSDEES